MVAAYIMIAIYGKAGFAPDLPGLVQMETSAGGCQSGTGITGETMTAPVLFQEKPLTNQGRYGIATLNQPAKLNSLSLEMCQLLTEQLTLWEQDPAIAFVIFEGAGDKAFCAGGDLHQLYTSMQQYSGKPAADNVYAAQFFDVEYRLDYQIHTYSKPIICWGHGVVMGGGIGLMAGTSHRVVSESSRLAMPEVTIGLFPDVGGSWDLNHLAGRIGRFLAATGAILNAADSLFTGMADYCVRHADWSAIIADLERIDGTHIADRRQLDQRIHNVLAQHSAAATLDPGPLQTHYALLTALCANRDVVSLYRAFAALADHADPWLARAAQTMLKGAPISVALGLTLQERALHLSLAQVFQLEYKVALNCCAHGQLQEGIRALLIDKDKNPQWQPATIEQITPADIDALLSSPWQNASDNPLASLG